MRTIAQAGSNPDAMRKKLPMGMVVEAQLQREKNDRDHALKIRENQRRYKEGKVKGT